MRLSESLRRNIIEVTAGGLINKFKFKKRRTTLFFEDILANYIRACEDAGYGGKMKEIGKKWGALGTKQLGMPAVFRSIRLLNYVAKTVWHNLGLFDDCKVSKENNIILIETKKEFITRVIGKNEFMAGFYEGCLASYFGVDERFIKSETGKVRSKYIFELAREPYDVKCKDKEAYNKLNELPDNAGFTLKDALGSRMFSLKENRIYFRGKSILIVENTVFHIISNENILMERLSQISHSFFKEIVKEQAPPEKKLMLLKNLLQTMGWCNMKMLFRGDGIKMELAYLPVGLQHEADNWTFLAKIISGYLRLIDKRFYAEKIMQRNTGMNIIFSKTR